MKTFICQHRLGQLALAAVCASEEVQAVRRYHSATDTHKRVLYCIYLQLHGNCSIDGRFYRTVLKASVPQVGDFGIYRYIARKSTLNFAVNSYIPKSPTYGTVPSIEKQNLPELGDLGIYWCIGKSSHKSSHSMLTFCSI